MDVYIVRLQPCNKCIPLGVLGQRYISYIIDDFSVRLQVVVAFLSIWPMRIVVAISLLLL